MQVRTTYTWRWKDRNGMGNSISVKSFAPYSPEEYDNARDTAIRMGYPGHEGGWWNWFVDDCHAFLTRISATFKSNPGERP